MFFPSVSFFFCCNITSPVDGTSVPCSARERAADPSLYTTCIPRSLKSYSSAFTAERGKGNLTSFLRPLCIRNREIRAAGIRTGGGGGGGARALFQPACGGIIIEADARNFGLQLPVSLLVFLVLSRGSRNGGCSCSRLKGDGGLLRCLSRHVFHKKGELATIYPASQNGSFVTSPLPPPRNNFNHTPSKFHRSEIPRRYRRAGWFLNDPKPGASAVPITIGVYGARSSECSNISFNMPENTAGDGAEHTRRRACIETGAREEARARRSSSSRARTPTRIPPPAARTPLLLLLPPPLRGPHASTMINVTARVTTSSIGAERSYVSSVWRERPRHDAQALFNYWLASQVFFDSCRSPGPERALATLRRPLFFFSHPRSTASPPPFAHLRLSVRFFFLSAFRCRGLGSLRGSL